MTEIINAWLALSVNKQITLVIGLWMAFGCFTMAYRVFYKRMDSLIFSCSFANGWLAVRLFLTALVVWPCPYWAMDKYLQWTKSGPYTVL